MPAERCLHDAVDAKQTDINFARAFAVALEQRAEFVREAGDCRFDIFAPRNAFGKAPLDEIGRRFEARR